MATVVGLNRGTWEHSTFKFPSLYMSLTINAKDDLGENLLPCTLMHRTSSWQNPCHRMGTFSSVLQWIHVETQSYAGRKSKISVDKVK